MFCDQVSYLCVLRAVGRSAGTQPDQKMRIRQLVSSTILIFLVCFSPYHIFLLVRTLLERDCNFITGTGSFQQNRKMTEDENICLKCFSLHFFLPGIFNYYHLSLLLTTLNCVADPALYCFVSESARRGLYRAIFRPVARVLCCCCRRGNASPGNPTTDSHEVATDENNGHPTVTLLTHTNTLNNVKTDTSRKDIILITQTDEKTIKPSTVQNNRHSDKCLESDGKPSCVIAMGDQNQKTED